ncbi:MAG: hypothetical protein HY711_10220, partial [Candidatus Melainabacteria bacterium]|nr:hypothetical protein [Candidatus Melainabacteria bacterium]
NGNVGYIRMDNMDYPFDVDDVRRAMHKLGPCEAYVIDLRECRYGNLDGAIGMTSFFLDQGTVTSITVRTPPYTGDTYVTYTLHPAAIQTITWTPPTQTGPPQYFVDYKPREFNLSAGRPTYVLTRGRTAHAAEIFCAALRDNRRATLLGVPTHGDASVPIVVQDAYRRTTIVFDGIFYSPNRQCIGSGIISCSGGLKPDVFVRPDAGIQYGTDNDNQLKEALRRLGK